MEGSAEFRRCSEMEPQCESDLAMGADRSSATAPGLPHCKKLDSVIIVVTSAAPWVVDGIAVSKTGEGKGQSEGPQHESMIEREV